jgi:hypothetical protein
MARANSRRSIDLHALSVRGDTEFHQPQKVAASSKAPVFGTALGSSERNELAGPFAKKILRRHSCQGANQTLGAYSALLQNDRKYSEFLLASTPYPFQNQHRARGSKGKTWDRQARINFRSSSRSEGGLRTRYAKERTTSDRKWRNELLTTRTLHSRLTNSPAILLAPVHDSIIPAARRVRESARGV